eukprot:570396-Alexandrium_andersonii.AAC.1
MQRERDSRWTSGRTSSSWVQQGPTARPSESAAASAPESKAAEESVGGQASASPSTFLELASPPPSSG